MIRKLVTILICAFVCCACVYVQAQDIYPDHPRIFVRDVAEWADGLTVRELRQRASWGDWNNAWRRISSGSAQSRGLPTAAIGYLVTQDEGRAKSVIEVLKTESHNLATTNEIWNKYEMLHDVSIAFDWVYNSLSLSDRDKKFIVENLARAGEKMVKYIKSDHHIFGRAMAQAASVGMAGIALKGEAKEADELLAFSLKEMENIFDALKLLDGAWAEGLGYLNEVRLSCLLEFLEAYKSATVPMVDYFKVIERSQGGWLKKMLMFHVYNLRPDYTWARYGDMSSFKAYPKDNYAQNLEILTTEYQDSAASEMLYKLEKAIAPDPLFYKGYLFKYMLFHDPQVPAAPGLKGLANQMMFGQKSLGYVNVRSGFEESDTWFRYNCGDYFTGHQHSDQGNFVLFKYSPLIIDSGYYSEWGSIHREDYYRRTVAHNTMLVYQPDEKFQTPYKYGKFNDGGQRTVWYSKGQAQQRIFSVDEYLSKKDKGPNYETGDINNFEAANRYVYIDSDVTAAYNNPNFSAERNSPKIDKVTRKIVVLKPEYLFVIYDYVSSLKKEYPKTWVAHTLVEPEIVDGEFLNAGFGFAKFSSGTVKVTNGEGRLFIKTLYPEKSNTTFVGGPGYGFWVNGEDLGEGVPLSPPPHSEVGSWRIEIEPGAFKEKDVFLNVLYPCSADDEKMPDTERIEVKNGVGALIGETVVIFSDNEKEVSYSLTAQGEVSNLVFGLSPESIYRVESNNPAQELKTTASGVLAFNAEDKTSDIKIVKVE